MRTGLTPELETTEWDGELPHSELVRSDHRWDDLERLRSTHPMMDAVIDEVRGRQIRIGDRWLCDFASCNYLGFDFHPEIIESVRDELGRWGTHPSWSRLLGNPRLYVDIEEQLTELLGAPDSLLLPTITIIHSSVIPLLAGQGAVIVDAQAHKTIYDGCVIARGAGATFRRMRTNDPEDLEQILRSLPPGCSRLVCMDGVNSMSGNTPNLPEYVRICGEYDALLYVDDAHGFGVIGEDPTAKMPYGKRGNGIVRHFDLSYDNVVLVSGFSKSYSSLLAFLALPTRLKNHLKVAAAPYLYSGPSPVASLATVLAGFRVNDAEGDHIRSDLYEKTARVLDRIRELGLMTLNRSGLPIIELPIGEGDEIDKVGRFLFDRGIYVTLAAYPLVPKSQVGFRIQLTAANSDDEVARLNEVLGDVASQFRMQRTSP
jgi:7-keto-8-aminopelargonate synthetase-like enzyme